jgi:glutamate-1-semialdehyde 2,1-aminomutase
MANRRLHAISKHMQPGAVKGQTAATGHSLLPATVSMGQLEVEYRHQNPRSADWFDRAQASLPMGNTRTGSYYKPYPIYWEAGEGPIVIDIDGNRRLDFVNQATCLTLGHAYPPVVAAIRERAGKGTAFFGPSRYEVELAEELKRRIPSMQHIRFCSSGTEAVMNAHRVARAFTGRPLIAKFEGSYHGVDDPALISYLPPLGEQLGPDNAPASVPVSPGLAPGTAESTLVLPFNDAGATKCLIEARASEISAVIIDPLSTAAGTCIPTQQFLTTLREVTAKHGILLIFDEIVAFRIAEGGAQQVFGIVPDLTTLGKVIAGGTPGAAFGGRKDVMAIYRPDNAWPNKIPQYVTPVQLCCLGQTFMYV